MHVHFAMSFRMLINCSQFIFHIHFIIQIIIMGNGQQGHTLKLEKQQITMKRISKLTVIGRGGFGKVWKVEVKKTRRSFAMKEMSKAKILMKKSVESVINELQLLKCLKHDFLINAVLAFQDRENLYLLMDLLTGGDLRFHLIKNTKFNEENTKFFAACVMVALEFLHNNGILHRDLKPENLVFDKNGYIRLTDLGVARIWKPENHTDTSGTPGYMAPEVMCRCNHGVSVDYFALGVIVYECMLGYRPYTGGSRQEIRDKILSRQAKVKKHDIPYGWSEDAIDFINSMIERKPQNRLGLNGPSEVMKHPWFSSINWELLKCKKLHSPFMPIYHPEQYQDQLSAIQDLPITAETLILLKKQAIQNVFAEYNYDGASVQNPLIQKAYI